MNDLGPLCGWSAWLARMVPSWQIFFDLLGLPAPMWNSPACWGHGKPKRDPTLFCAEVKEGGICVVGSQEACNEAKEKYGLTLISPFAEAK